MNTVKQALLTIRLTARLGTRVSLALILGYGVAFAAFVIVRSSFNNWPQLPSGDPGRPLTLIANTVCILIPFAAVAGVLAVVMAVPGVFTALLIHWLLSRWNRTGSVQRATLVGGGTAAVLTITTNLIVIQLLGSKLSQFWPSAYLTWLGLPSLLYVTAGAWGGRQLVKPPGVKYPGTTK